MLNFIICDDDIHMINKLSLLFEKTFIKNDFEAKIVLKTQNYKDILSFMSSNIVNVVVLDIEFKSAQRSLYAMNLSLMNSFICGVRETTAVGTR